MVVVYTNFLVTARRKPLSAVMPAPVAGIHVFLNSLM
jgi:hypothetical protein